MVPVDVPQVPARLDDVADAPLEFFGLGEAAVCFAVPEEGGFDGRGGGGGGGGGIGRGRGRRGGGVSLGMGVEDFYHEGSPRGGLEGDFAQAGGECGEEFLGVLGEGLVFEYPFGGEGEVGDGIGNGLIYIIYKEECDEAR